MEGRKGCSRREGVGRRVDTKGDLRRRLEILVHCVGGALDEALEVRGPTSGCRWTMPE